MDKKMKILLKFYLPLFFLTVFWILFFAFCSFKELNGEVEKEKISETSPIIFVEKPIRASDAFITQNEIAKTLITVSNGATAMLDTQSAKQHKQYIQKITILSGSIDLNKIDEKSDEIIKKLQKRKGIKHE